MESIVLRESRVLFVTRAFAQDEDELRRAERVARTIEKSLRGELRLTDALAARPDPGKGLETTFALAPEVTIAGLMLIEVAPEFAAAVTTNCCRTPVLTLVSG